MHFANQKWGATAVPLPPPKSATDLKSDKTTKYSIVMRFCDIGKEAPIKGRLCTINKKMSLFGPLTSRIGMPLLQWRGQCGDDANSLYNS